MDTKKTFGTNLKFYRRLRDLTLEDIAKKVGTTKSCVSYWENGKSQPTADALTKLCEILSVTPAQLYTPPLHEMTDLDYNRMFPKDSIPKNAVEIKKVNIPILGKIACGRPIYAEETYEGYVSVNDGVNYDFGLWAEGDSMIDARIYDGDLVFIRKQDMVENGEIAAVLIDEEATLKRVYYDEQNGVMTLMAANPKYAPFVYRGEELNNIRILGKAVNFLGVVR